MNAPSSAPATVDRLAGRLAPLLAKKRPLVMGVLNVTPDSFSDGGKFQAPEAALDHARRLVSEGADIIDIGAESTRPYAGATPVTVDEELRRLEPVLPEVTALGVPVSIDTMKARVAEWAIGAGAAIVNDVWGLRRDPDMARVVAAAQVPLIAMYNRDKADSTDIMADIKIALSRSLEIADRAGIARDRIVLDPGIGFGMTAEQCLTVIARLAELKAFGRPILVGASRKRFIDKVSPAPSDRRLGGSIASHLLAVINGAAIVRVHDVAETVQALKVMAAIRGQR
jgi:dihydropteroate synthase